MTILHLKKAINRIKKRVGDTFRELRKPSTTIARGVSPEQIKMLKGRALDDVETMTIQAVFASIGITQARSEKDVSKIASDFYIANLKTKKTQSDEQQLDKIKSDLAQIVSESFPEQYNGIHPQLVYSKYYNTVDTYREAIPSSVLRDSNGIQIEDPIITIGTKDFAIGKDGQDFGSEELDHWLMSSGSAIAKVKTLMSEAKARSFESNEKNALKWVADNVAQLEHSGLDANKTAQIDETVDDLRDSGILSDAIFAIKKGSTSLGLDLDFIDQEADLDKSASQSAMVVQNFLKTFTKSKLIETLKRYDNPRTGEKFTEAAYDAMLTLISRQMGAVFEDILKEKVVKRYSTKKVQTVVEGEGEEGSDAKQSEVVNEEKIKGFVERWIKYPSYQVKGALSQQSLPGFIGFILDIV